MLWGCFSIGRDWETGQNGAKYREIIEGNQFVFQRFETGTEVHLPPKKYKINNTSGLRGNI